MAIDQQADLEHLYGVSDFASLYTRSRSGVADVQFAAIFGVADGEALMGYALAGAQVLQFPSAAVDLQPGDVVAGPEGSFAVRRVERIVDGAESVAVLSAGV